MSEGSHSLSCGKCLAVTRVHVERVGKSANNLTLRTEADQAPKTQSSSPPVDATFAHEASDALLELDIKEMVVAKRKLSDEQRLAIREEINEKLTAGVPRATVVKALASKYKISPISLRWYIRTQPGAGKGKVRLIPAQAPVAQTPESAAQSRPDAAIVGAADGGQLTPMTEILDRLSDEKMKRLLEAKKLIPELKVVRRHESEIRGKIRILERQLHAEESKAKGIEQRIKRLSGF